MMIAVDKHKSQKLFYILLTFESNELFSEKMLTIFILKHKLETLKHTVMMKLLNILTAIAILIFMGSCSKDDDSGTPPVNDASLFGKWEIISGRFVSEDDKYIEFNTDNTMHIFLENNNGFRNQIDGTIATAETQIDINFGFGGATYEYELGENTLTLSRSDGNLVELKVLETPEIISNWVIPIQILSEGISPKNDYTDIAFNGTQLVVGNGYLPGNIDLVNPETFAVEGEIITSHNVTAVEIENYEFPGRYTFQSNGADNTFYAYREDTNAFVFQSNPITSYISGLASVDIYSIWVGSGSNGMLYLYNYDTQTIVRSITINSSIKGLDYHGGYLYMSLGSYIYKCDVSSDFEIVETYKLPNTVIYGIAFDNTNFWVHAETSDNIMKLIKTNLTL